MARVKCSYADKYQAILPPACGCEVCNLKWQVACLAELGAALGLALRDDPDCVDHCNDLWRSLPAEAQEKINKFVKEMDDASE